MMVGKSIGGTVVGKRTVALAAALLIGILGSAARGSGDPAKESGGGAPATPPVKLDAKGKELADKTEALAKEAAAVVAEYRKAISERVDKLSEENPTLSRLKRAGVFSIDGLLAGVPSEPLSGLPEMRRVYETLDETADRYVKQFGGVAKQRAEAAAIEYLKKIIQAETTYREDDKDGNGILEYTTSFHDLGQLKLLHVPSSVKRGDDTIVVEGYKFRIVAANTLQWAVIGSPVSIGEYHLYSDETGVIRAEKGKQATKQSPVYDPAKEPKDGQ
jgi:hypothetical protein